MRHVISRKLGHRVRRQPETSRSTDRVVEVGIVQLDANADITGQFCSLINPGRNVGPTHLHGIAAANVYDAPALPPPHPCHYGRPITGRIPDRAGPCTGQTDGGARKECDNPDPAGQARRSTIDRVVLEFA